jgi:hypothetical protein
MSVRFGKPIAIYLANDPDDFRHGEVYAFAYTPPLSGKIPDEYTIPGVLDIIRSLAVDAISAEDLAYNLFLVQLTGNGGQPPPYPLINPIVYYFNRRNLNDRSFFETEYTFILRYFKENGKGFMQGYPGEITPTPEKRTNLPRRTTKKGYYFQYPYTPPARPPLRQPTELVNIPTKSQTMRTLNRIYYYWSDDSLQRAFGVALEGQSVCNVINWTVKLNVSKGYLYEYGMHAFSYYVQDMYFNKVNYRIPIPMEKLSQSKLREESITDIFDGLTSTEAGIIYLQPSNFMYVQTPPMMQATELRPLYILDEIYKVAEQLCGTKFAGGVR